MTRLGRMRPRLFLTLKSLPAYLAPNTRICQPQKQPYSNTKKTHLALQIERRSVRVRAFSPQLRRERTQRLEHALSLCTDGGHDARAELLGRARLRGEHRGVVVDPGIDEQRAALARAAVVGGAKNVDAAGLDVDARDLDPVVRCQDRELDRAAPGEGGEDRADVLVARTTCCEGGKHEAQLNAEGSKSSAWVFMVFICGRGGRTLRWRRSKCLNPSGLLLPRLPHSSEELHDTQSARGRRTLSDCGCLSHVLLKNERNRSKHTRIVVWHNLRGKRPSVGIPLKGSDS